MDTVGKTIKEIDKGISYCYIYFTDGTFIDIDIKGDAYIDYCYGKHTETGVVYFKKEEKK